MARTARSEYLSPDEEAVFYIRCRANRALLLPAHHSHADAVKHRVEYIEGLIRLYACHFAISVHAHAVTRREIRLVLQSRPELAAELDDAEIARRWLCICPTLRRGDVPSDEPSDEEIQALCQDPSRIAQIRRQLSDISWLMRLLQQRVAQLCNREDRREGRFWQSRFRAMRLLDAMSHLAAIVNVDLAAVRIRSGKAVSASRFTSQVYRRKSLENCSQGVTNRSVEAPTEVLPENPSDDLGAVASEAHDGIAAITECRDDRHLAPISHCDTGVATAARQVGQNTLFRCSDESVLDMHLRDYVEILEQTSLGCQPADPKLFSLKLREVLRELQLTFHQWVILAGHFEKLFSHVAGKLATMDAFRSKRSKHQACVRSVARVLLRARRVS
jgi:hypothetical protein